jgi:hypothetical protein
VAEELRPHIRGDAPPVDTTVVVRGGPDTADKLARHAVRTNRAYQLDGRLFWGVSVFLALDETGDASLNGLLSGRMRTYRCTRRAWSRSMLPDSRCCRPSADLTSR